MEAENFTIKKIHQGLLKKEFSAVELAKIYLDRIKKQDKKINSFLFLSEDSALSQAKRIDKMIEAGKKIPVLAGVPCAIKDNILVADLPCTAGSKILENYIAPYDATIIEKLKKQGIVILGKTNMDEFGMGSSTENSAFGPTRNPCDLTRVPGGTSGGSAAAVASDMCVAALGSDTGGSIRQPASFCGVVGLKPSYGAVSRYGLIAFASSLDQIGPMTKTSEDAKIVFEAIKGKDALDSTSIESDSKSQIPNREFVPASKFDADAKILNSKFQIQNLRIGIPKEYFGKGIDVEVEKIIRKAIKKFEDLGAKIEDIGLPHTEYSLSSYYIIVCSEASANLARYDGLRFGSSAKKKTETLIEQYFQNRGQGFGSEVKRRIMLGTYSLSAGYYDVYYLKAQKVRIKIKQDFEKAFEKIDFILTSVSPTPAFRLGEKIEDPLKMYLSDIFTVSVSLAGLPAVSVPAGRIGNLPVGIQIIGRPFEEEKILSIAEIFQNF